MLPSRALVPSLLRSGSPTAISRLIVAIGVDTVKRCSRGTWSHIRQEVGKHAPTVTNLDSTSAVVVVRRTRGIINSPQHRCVGAPSAVVGALLRRTYATRRSLRRPLGLDFPSGLLGVRLSGHWVARATIVTAHEFANAITPLVNGGIFTTAATAEKRLQRSPILLVALGLGDTFSSFFGVMPTLNCHTSSVYQGRLKWQQ